MRISKAFWIWAQFEEQDLAYINSLKKEVQMKLNSPIFEPHITMAGPFEEIDISFINSIKELSQSTNSISVNLLQYRFEIEPFKSFYIAVSSSKNLINIRNKINEKHKFDNYQIFEPHISLSYGVHLPNSKNELINELPKLKSTIKLNKLSIVDVDEQISQWRIIERFELEDSKKNL